MRRAGYTHRKRNAILGALGAVVVAIALFFVIVWVENSMKNAGKRGDTSVRDQYYAEQTIEYQGRTYRKRKVKTLLLMGIDRDSTNDLPDGQYRNGGQADFLRLLVIDDENERINQIAIDRDTMTPITILGVLGNHAGLRTERVSLSHGFGDGKEQSCEFTVEAVSNLFYDTPIDYYVALDMDGIDELNAWLGGVTVTLEDDFTAIDPTMEQGKTITLAGNQAEIYVRFRRGVGEQTNSSRMDRQEQFLDQASEILRKKLDESAQAAENLYESLNSYFTTNMSRGRMTNEIHKAAGYKLEEVVRTSGEHSIDEQGFMQFVVSEDSLQEIVVQTFYEPVG